MNWPGVEIWMRPPHVHMQVDPAVRAGIPPSITVDEPGAHGAGTSGTQGIGVSTPSAAAVAAATVGLAMLVHMANGKMLAGVWSITVAAGIDEAFTRFVGMTINEDGATPKLHVSIAPLVT